MQFKKSEATQVSQQFLTTQLLRLIVMATIAFDFYKPHCPLPKTFLTVPLK